MLEAVYDDFKGDADYLFVLGLIYMNNAQFSKAVESFLAATQIPSCVVDGVNSYSAFYNIGVILECLGDTKNALVYYEKPATIHLLLPESNDANKCNPLNKPEYNTKCTKSFRGVSTS